jgi:hypothetical protein
MRAGSCRICMSATAYTTGGVMGIIDWPSSAPARRLQSVLDFLQAVVFGATSMGALIGAIFAIAGEDIWPITRTNAPLAFIACQVALGAVLYYYVRYRYNPRQFTIEELVGSLTIERVGHHHRFTYERQQRIRADRDGLRHVPIRSHWSGQSRRRSIVEAMSADYRVYNETIPEADGRIYRIIYLFGPIARGHRTSVGIRHRFEDDFQTMKPYYRESGDDLGARKMKIVVRFPKDYDPSHMEGVIWRSRGLGDARHEAGRLEYQRVDDTESGFIEYTIDVARPSRRAAYGLRWEWRPVVDPADHGNSQRCSATAPS